MSSTLPDDVIERLAGAVDGRLSSTVLVITTDVEDVLDHIQAQAVALAERDAQAEQIKRLREALHRIAHNTMVPLITGLALEALKEASHD